MNINVTNKQVLIVASEKEACGMYQYIPTLARTRKLNTYICSHFDLPILMEKNFTPEDIKRCIESNEIIRNAYEKATTNLAASLELKNTPLKVFSKEQDTFWGHQILGTKLAKLNSRYGFFYDTRTGKTGMSLKIMKDILTENAIHGRCLVICPSAIITSWLSDAAEFFPELKMAAYYGTDKQKREALSKPSHVIVWSMEQATANLDFLMRLKFDAVFIDESSKLKSNKSQISNAMLKLSEKQLRWYLLSATPAPNGEHEYYTQMRTVDPGIFSDVYAVFKDKYFIDTSRSNNFEKLVIRPDKKAEFMDEINKRAIYVDQSVMPTAGKEFILHKYSLDNESAIAYESMRKTLSMSVATQNITVDMITQARMKLMQITSGFIMDTDAINANKLARKFERISGISAEEERKQEIYKFSNSRVDELLSILNDKKDEQIVIWANFKQEFVDIATALGSRCAVIRGETSTADKMKCIDLFRQKRVQYLVCHPLSVGMGINLTVAHIAIYYSITDSWEAFKQSSERIAGHIKVQPYKCEYYIMAAKKTIDELVYANVSQKRDLSRAVLDYLSGNSIYD